MKARITAVWVLGRGKMLWGKAKNGWEVNCLWSMIRYSGGWAAELQPPSHPLSSASLSEMVPQLSGLCPLHHTDRGCTNWRICDLVLILYSWVFRCMASITKISNYRRHFFDETCRPLNNSGMLKRKNSSSAFLKKKNTKIL